MPGKLGGSGGRKRRGAFAREDGVVRDFFFQSSYIYKDISLQI